MRLIAGFILLAHLTWLVLTIFGALWTRGRPFWTTAHLLALIWGIVVEVGPWACPLTLAEQYFEGHAGMASYQGSFLLHLFESTVYPNLPYWLVATCGVAVCSLNLGIYLWRFRQWVRQKGNKQSGLNPV